MAINESEVDAFLTDLTINMYADLYRFFGFAPGIVLIVDNIGDELPDYMHSNISPDKLKILLQRKIHLIDHHRDDFEFEYIN